MPRTDKQVDQELAEFDRVTDDSQLTPLERVERFLEAWDRPRGGVDPDEIFILWTIPNEDYGRVLRASDLHVLVQLARENGAS